MKYTKITAATLLVFSIQLAPSQAANPQFTPNAQNQFYQACVIDFQQRRYPQVKAEMSAEEMSSAICECAKQGFLANDKMSAGFTENDWTLFSNYLRDARGNASQMKGSTSEATQAIMMAPMITMGAANSQTACMEKLLKKK